MTTTAQVPDAWQNIQPELPFALPPDLPSPKRPAARYRHPRAAQPDLPGDEPASRYRGPRRGTRPLLAVASHPAAPRPVLRGGPGHQVAHLRQVRGGNLSGSHKLNTAVAQAHYYQREPGG